MVWSYSTALANSRNKLVQLHPVETSLLLLGRKPIQFCAALGHALGPPTGLLNFDEHGWRVGKGYKEISLFAAFSDRLPLEDSKAVSGLMERRSRLGELCITMLRISGLLDNRNERRETALPLQKG
jgi:hypothetical protein